MKTYKVKRTFITYTVDASSPSKAKYAAYKKYRKRRRRPTEFFPWVKGVKKVSCVE